MTWRVVHPPLSSSGHMQARKKNSSVSGACNSQWTLSEAKCMQRARATWTHHNNVSPPRCS